MLAFLTAVLFAASTPESAFRQALGSDADWVMERRLPGVEKVLVSSGTVSCRLGTGIVWRTVAPFESSVEMTTNSMVFADEEGTRIRPLESLSHYSEIRERTDAFASGDEKAFEGMFSIERQDLPGGGWRLVMRPEISALEHLMKEVSVSGAQLPTNVVMRTADGGVTNIRFKERPIAR